MWEPGIGNFRNGPLWASTRCDLPLALQMSPGIIANPFAAGIGRKNSLESISSIDRDLSPEELEILQKVCAVAELGARYRVEAVSGNL